MLKIRLIPNHQHGELISVLDSKNLSVELVHLIKASLVCDSEDQQKAFPRAHVLLPHSTELFLARCVQDCKTSKCV